MLSKYLIITGDLPPDFYNFVIKKIRREEGSLLAV